MKLRTMICAMAASTALFATDIPSSNVYGVMSVSDTVTSNTVVGVPWMNLGEATPASAVTLSNLVSTATLESGDIVYLYEGATWYGYQLSAAGVWEPMTTVSGASASATPDAADLKTLTRGTGLIVQRAHNQNPIYLCGRYEAATGLSSTIPAGATVLIANPLTEAKTIANTFGSTGDQISVPKNGGGLETYERRADGWYGTTTTTVGNFTVKKKVKLDNGVEIAAGKGAWYISKNDADVTIQW